MTSGKNLTSVPYLQSSGIGGVESAISTWNSEAGLKLVLESAPMAIVTVDITGRIIFVNTRLAEMFGYDRGELIGQKVELLIPQRFWRAHVNHRSEYVAHPKNRSMGSGLELVAQRKDGAEFPIEVGLSYVQLEEQMLIVGTINDVSLRKQAEVMLERRVEERTKEIERRRMVADGLRDILRILNSNRSSTEILNYIVAQASRLLGADASAVYKLQEGNSALTIQTSQGLPEPYTAQGSKITGKGATRQAALTHRPIALPDLAQSLLEGDSESRARRQLLLDYGYQALLAVPLLIKEEAYGSLVLYYQKAQRFSNEETDLAVTFADQAALAIENARLRTQVEQAAIVAERSRLARDLHDSVTQTLFSASLIAEVLPKLWERKHTEGKRRLEELRQLTRGALAEMRTLLLELRPTRLTEVSLNELLRQLSEAVNGRARVPIDLKIQGECTLLPEVQIAFYRTAQEALNNVAKHAQATKVEVRLNCRPDSVDLSIKDNGRGFDPAGVRPKSLGLSIMKERAETINAELNIMTELGQGTNVILKWENR